MLTLSYTPYPAFSQPKTTLLPWMDHQDSLTAKLREQTGDARVKLLKQCWRLPNWWDRHTLHLNESVLHREILMLAHETPCWYARTIIPISSYKTQTQFFDRLQQEHLGALLFNNPDVKRDSLLSYAIDQGTMEYYWLNSWISVTAKTLWARLAKFTLHEKMPIFLMEIFLPDFERYLP